MNETKLKARAMRRLKFASDLTICFGASKFLTASSQHASSFDLPEHCFPVRKTGYFFLQICSEE
jgi:hypothetical protein